MTAQSSRIGVADRMVGEPEWQRGWFALQRREWSSLAVIGTESGAEAEAAARHLATIGTRDGLRPVKVISALGLSFADSSRLVDVMAEAAANDDLVIVVCEPLHQNAAVLPVLNAVSGVVLVAQLGVAQTMLVKKTVQAVGRERIVATVSVG